MNSHPRSTIIFLSGRNRKALKTWETFLTLKETGGGGKHLFIRSEQITCISNSFLSRPPSLILGYITHNPVNEWGDSSIMILFHHCQSVFPPWLIQWDDPTRRNRPLLPRALFLESVCRVCGGGEEGRGRPIDPYDKPFVFDLAVSGVFRERRVTCQPCCTETFFVCTWLWEVNKVVYPVFGNRARCTAWQTLQCF